MAKNKERKDCYIQNQKDVDDFYIYHSVTGIGEAIEDGKIKYGEDFIIRFATDEDINKYQDKLLAECEARLIVLILE